MSNIPMSSADLQGTAKHLRVVLSYLSISVPHTGKEFTLQQTQDLLGKLFGCTGWVDLKTRVALQKSFIYINDNKDAKIEHRVLADKLCEILAGDDLGDRAYRAVGITHLGCSPEVRRLAWSVFRSVLNNFPGKKAEQVDKAMLVDRGYNYLLRYQKFETEREYKAFYRRWEQDRAKALA